MSEKIKVVKNSMKKAKKKPVYKSKDRMCEYYRDLEGDEDGCTKEE